MENFYKNKRVLVTGHNGFKGSWLCLMLKLLNAQVYGISLKKDDRKKNNLIKIFNLKKKITEYFVDINNYKILNKTVKKIRPEIIFHLAAQSIVIDGYKNPTNTLNTNINGLINLLESVKLSDQIKTIAIITSDKCYVNNNKRYFTEDSHLGGDDPYSASKACAEIVSNCYAKSFLKKINLITFRAGNVIGGGDFNTLRLVPDIIKKIFYGKKLIIRNLTHQRPWQDVIDLNFAYLVFTYFKAIKKIKINTLNIGPNKNYSVKSILKMFNKFKNYKYKLKKSIFDEKLNIKLDCKKSNQIFKIKKNSINNTIKNIYRWHQIFKEKKREEIIFYSKNLIFNVLKKNNIS
ncbi:WcaG Nucleoside-diphosphate-sugar epimerases [Candidatus Pelagibacterales bacterium]